MATNTVIEGDRLRFGGVTYLGHFDGGSAFEKMYDGFRETLHSRPELCHESYYTFAGRLVRFRIIGYKLTELITLPFSHLRTEEFRLENLNLTIDLWDENETGIPCPVDSLQVGHNTPRPELYAEYCFVKASPDSRFIGSQRPQMMTLFDRTTQHLVGSVSSGEALSFFECGKPLQFPLLLWHHDRDTPVIHSGLVSKNDKGVLFVGKGGSGKTTATLSCLLSGFDYLGDDYIGLQPMQDGLFAGHSLYGSTWIMADHSKRFPLLSPYLTKPQRPDQEKSLVHLSQIFPRKLVRMAKICVIVLPIIKDGLVPGISPASKKEALLALAPSSMILLPSSGSPALDRLAQLVERVQCYRLEVGGNLTDIPHWVEEILGRISQT